MKHKCTVCNNEFELAEDTLPFCPACVKAKMKHPKGLSPKHMFGTAPPYASYIADGVDAEAIYDYMAGGAHPGPSGCKVFYSAKHNSLNAVSHKPLGQIPGSGNFNGKPQANQFAVWVDIEGNSSQGPHLMFEDETHLNSRLCTSEWVPAPKCANCGKVVVRTNGDICLNCKI